MLVKTLLNRWSRQESREEPKSKTGAATKYDDNDVKLLRGQFRQLPLGCRPLDYSVNQTTGRVRKLNLCQIRFIPMFLVRQLDHLEELSIRHHKTPSLRFVMASIYQWKSLKALHLHHFAVSDAVLCGISALRHLHTLTVWCDDSILGSPKDSATRTPTLSCLRDIPNLRRLNLYGSARDMSAVFELTGLEELSLMHAAEVPPAIGKMKHLKKLTIAQPIADFRERSWLPLELEQCRELDELNLMKCPPFMAPFALSAFKHLSTIHASNCDACSLVDFFLPSHQLRDSLPPLESLKYLKLENMDLPPGALRKLLGFVEACCPNLESFVLDWNHIDSLDNFSSFGHNHLRSLSLMGNPVTKSRKHSDRQQLIRMLKQCPQLKVHLTHPESAFACDLMTLESQHYLDLNTNGRCLVQSPNEGEEPNHMPISLWPAVLERTNRSIPNKFPQFEPERLACHRRRANAVYYLLQNCPLLWTPRFQEARPYVPAHKAAGNLEKVQPSSASDCRLERISFRTWA